MRHLSPGHRQSLVRVQETMMSRLLSIRQTSAGVTADSIVLQGWGDLMRLDVMPEIPGFSVAYQNHPEALYRFYLALTDDSIDRSDETLMAAARAFGVEDPLRFLHESRHFDNGARLEAYRAGIRVALANRARAQFESSGRDTTQMSEEQLVSELMRTLGTSGKRRPPPIIPFIFLHSLFSHRISCSQCRC